MMRYVLRRFLHMIPTMAGVVLITFMLFNLVGGSPARMMLGDKASARELESFDEQRGFNRPLFWGRYSPTRILPETDFNKSAGPWSFASTERIVTNGHSGLLLRGGTNAIPFPLAFNPMPHVTYEWRISGQAVGAAGRIPVVKTSGGDITLEGGDGFLVSWRERASDPGDYRPAFEIPDGASIRLDRVECRRVNENPWQSQWSAYLRQLFTFDLGWSHSAGQPVAGLLAAGITPTLCLSVPILVGETLISLVLALLCAYRRNRLLDRLVLFSSVALMSVNYLVWIVAGQYWLGYKLAMFPVWGYESWPYLMLPVFIGVLHGLGPNVRFYRTVMLEEMHKDYVRTARAKGVGTRGILFRHVLKNAMIPVITNVVLSLPFLYTGSLLLETFFGIPGLGYLSVNAINSSDVDVVRAVVLIGSFLYLAANLLADLLYAVVDPRVKLS